MDIEERNQNCYLGGVIGRMMTQTEREETNRSKNSDMEFSRDADEVVNEESERNKWEKWNEYYLQKKVKS